MGDQTVVVAALHSKLSRLQNLITASPLVEIKSPELGRQGLELWIKRDDLLHTVISGNKWRKLKYCLQLALNAGADTLVSMGGAYSNHLHALAYAGRMLELKTIGYVRGEQPQQFSPTLTDLQHWGMELRFVSRSDYRALRKDSLPDLVAGQYWLPEGGASRAALQGVGEIVSEIDRKYDALIVACGTGTTLAGLVAAAPADKRIIGVAALKGGHFLYRDVDMLLPKERAQPEWQILQNYHFGGFGKCTPQLQAFIRQFESAHGVPLEAVYTGKALFALFDLARQGYFNAGQRIIFLHTGGLQGARTLNP